MTKEVGTNKSLDMTRPEKELEKKEDVDQVANLFANVDPMFGKDGVLDGSAEVKEREPGLSLQLGFGGLPKICLQLSLRQEWVT